MPATDDPAARPPANVHDSTVRAVFGTTELAQDLFRTFLPAGLLRHVDLSSLDLRPEHFIDPRLRWRMTDLLFRVRIDGRDAFVYLLFEHQSTVDGWMAWRLLRIVVLIWDNLLRDDEERTSLPLILPIVFSQAKRPWSAATNVRQLVDLPVPLPPTIEAMVPSLSYFLVDLIAMSNAKILALAASASLRIFLLIMRNIHDPQLPDMLRDWHALIAQIIREPSGLRLIELLLTYMTKAVPKMSEDALREFGQMAGLDPEIVEGSLAWKWIQEGRQEGRQEGLAPLIRLFQRRLGRELGAAECSLLGQRLAVVGPERLGDVVLDLSTEELEHWLADPAAS